MRISSAGAHSSRADRAQKLLLATDLGFVQLLVGRNPLPVFLLELVELGLPGGFANRFSLRVELVPVLGVVGATAPAITLLAVRPAPTRLAAVDTEVVLFGHNATLGAGPGVARHQGLSGAKTGGEILTARESGGFGFFETTPTPLYQCLAVFRPLS